MWLLPASIMMILAGGVATVLGVCYEWKTKCDNRIRAYRFAKELSKLNDREHVQWAQHLVSGRTTRGTS